MVHDFAQSTIDKNAYTVLFTEFVKNTLRIRNVPYIKVQQLRPSSCTQNGLSTAVVLLQSVSDVERILVAAAQYLDASSLIRINGSRTKAARVARVSVWSQQQNPAVARCAWQERGGSIVSGATEQNSPNLQQPIAQCMRSFCLFGQ